MCNILLFHKLVSNEGNFKSFFTVYSKQSIQPTLSPDAVTELQKGRFHILENLSVGRG